MPHSRNSSTRSYSGKITRSVFARAIIGEDTHRKGREREGEGEGEGEITNWQPHAQEARGTPRENQIKTRLYKTRHAALIPPTLPPEIEYSSAAIRTRNRMPFTANSSSPRRAVQPLLATLRLPYPAITIPIHLSPPLPLYRSPSPSLPIT